jgi:hypothetical protein
MMKDKTCQWMRWTMMALLLVISVDTMSGCTTLRRKFVRKSAHKNEKEAFIPVLQPEDYAPKVYTPEERYESHYTVVRAYYKDLWESLVPGGNVKRQAYLIGQVSAKFNAMAGLLQEPLAGQLTALAATIDKLLPELEKPDAMRRYDIMRGQVKTVETSFYRGFKPAFVKDKFIADKK